ncbi:MAG TPA: AMP-binding protein [Ohtaekwangia sp.]|nr:AMP-binding protein [Ohtaekwangia sp.]
MDYPHSSIYINNRREQLHDIITEAAAPRTTFETNTFNFIRQWFTGKSEFKLHTSGSTGEPKEIEITRAQMISSAQLTEQALDLKKEYTSLVCLDTRYIAGQMMMVRSFITGMYIVAVEPAANPLESLSFSGQIHFTAVVPYQLHRLLQAPQREVLNRFQTVIIGGAAVDQETLMKLKSLSCRCYATYGMTETVSHIALQKLNGETSSDLFHILPGISIDQDERGCLMISAPYLQAQQITNDIVEIINKTSFKWLGRWDNVINSGGVKISPEHLEKKIETGFQQLNLHHRYIISSVPDTLLQNKIVFVLEADTPVESIRKSLFELFLMVFDPYERPKEILGYFPFPETNTGKINRRIIKEDLSNRH